MLIWQRVGALLVALSLVAAACGSSSDSDDSDSPTDDEGSVEEESLDDLPMSCEVRDEADQEYQHRDVPVVVPDLLLVPNGITDQDLVSVEDINSNFANRAVIDLEDSEALAEFFGGRYSVGDEVQLAGDAAYLDSPVWLELASAFDLVWFPDRIWSDDDGPETSDIDAAIDALQGAEVEALPVHTVGYANHYGAFPGMKPHICTGEQEVDETNSGSGGDGAIVGVVDNGFWSVERPGGGFEYSTCQVSHGEFVADIIRQVNPTAEIYGTSAFNLKDASGVPLCSVTDTVGVFKAVAELVQLAKEEGIQLDRLNLSLGASAHDGYAPAAVAVAQADGGQPRTLVDLILGEVTNPQLSIYAAAGNTATDDLVYPASHSSVIGVGALIGVGSGESQVWDASEQPDGYDLPSASIRAPGCDLTGSATGDPSDRVVWGGSSFASAVAVALGARNEDDVVIAIEDGFLSSLQGISTGRCL